MSTRGWEAYSTSGNEDFFEPALGITHADGNMTTYLYYVSSSQEPVEGGTHTRINLKDDKYPVEVTLNYVAYPKEKCNKDLDRHIAPREEADCHVAICVGHAVFQRTRVLAHGIQQRLGP